MIFLYNDYRTQGIIKMKNKIEFIPIGVIRSPFKDIAGMPIQASLSGGVCGTVEIYPEFVEGLKSLDGFSHIYLIYNFHLSDGYSLEVKPFLDDAAHGVFATRAPKRPNHIGVSVVELMRIENSILHIKNVDIIDGTPLLDIKPYVRKFDCIETRKEGWLSGKTGSLNEHYSDDRFGK
jgi:tRNA-Thr(GGU) m(6)t(6)A37 methyltransferase TsaA